MALSHTYWWLRRALKTRDPAKAVDATGGVVLAATHALADEVQPQAAGLDFVQAAPAELRGVDSGAAIREQDFQALARRSSPREALAGNLDGLVEATVVAVTDDVGQRLIDGAGDGAAIGSRKAQHFGQALERAAHHTEHLGIAVQVQLQQNSVVGSGATVTISLPPGFQLFL